MMAVSALVRLIAILIVAAALPSRAEDAMSGRWEGTARVPADELTVIVDLAQENGTWVGSIIVPGLGLKFSGREVEAEQRVGAHRRSEVQCAFSIPLQLA
jgi:hypothetical protein